MPYDYLILGLLLGALTCVTLCTWRAMLTVERISGVSRRGDDRDRRDMHALLTMLVEKVTTYHPDLVRAHSKERIVKAQLDAAVEGAAINVHEAAGIDPEPPIETRYTTEELSTRQG